MSKANAIAQFRPPLPAREVIEERLNTNHNAICHIDGLLALVETYLEQRMNNGEEVVPAMNGIETARSQLDVLKESCDLVAVLAP